MVDVEHHSGIDWCIDCNMPTTRCLCKDDPKVVRVLLTVIYSDNSSVMVDIKNPDQCEISMTNDSGQDGPMSILNYNVFPADTRVDLNVSTKITRDEPAIISVYPTGT